MLLNKIVSLCKFWFRKKQIPVSGKFNSKFVKIRKSESPNATVQHIPHNGATHSSQRCNTFLTTRQLCRMWINGWHDYWLNLIRKRNFTDVSQSENAKNCCVVPKIEELQPLVFLQMGGAPQPWKSAARDFLSPKCLGVGSDGMRRIHGFHRPWHYPFGNRFWSYLKHKYTWVTHQHDQQWDTRHIGAYGGEMKNDPMWWALRCRQHQSLLPSNFIHEGTKRGRPSHFTSSDLVSEHVSW